MFGPQVTQAGLVFFGRFMCHKNHGRKLFSVDDDVDKMAKKIVEQKVWVCREINSVIKQF